jgi:NAD-dependent deacetylase
VSGTPISRDEQLDLIASWLRHAQAIVILTGAGISTESGIPDFRGPQGVWTKNPAAEKTANLQHYVSDPEVRKLAWQNRLSSDIWNATPNEGHRAIAQLADVANVHTLVTQNIDGLHQAAGSDPNTIVEIHGTVHFAKCLACRWRGPMAETLARVRAGEEDPACRVCGGMLKSATISFGENLVPEDLERSQQAAAEADVFLALGTSLGVYPAAALPEIAIRQGGRLVIGNAQETPFDSYADAVSREPLGEFLSALVSRVSGLAS